MTLSTRLPDVTNPSTRICEQVQDGTQFREFRPDPARKLSANLNDIYHSSTAQVAIIQPAQERERSKKIQIHKN